MCIILLPMPAPTNYYISNRTIHKLAPSFILYFVSGITIILTWFISSSSYLYAMRFCNSLQLSAIVYSFYLFSWFFIQPEISDIKLSKYKGGTILVLLGMLFAYHSCVFYYHNLSPTIDLSQPVNEACSITESSQTIFETLMANKGGFYRIETARFWVSTVFIVLGNIVLFDLIGIINNSTTQVSGLRDFYSWPYYISIFINTGFGLSAIILTIISMNTSSNEQAC